MPIENLFEQQVDHLKYKEIEYNGVMVVIENISEKQCRIIRVISTSPEDYMLPEIQPGSILNYSIS
jgi:hypothetical protein